VDPSLSTLKDYTLFGYNGTSWAEIPRTNLDMGGNTVALYGNVPGMLLRKQSGSQDKMASVEVSIPVPVSTYGNVMQFVNISTSIFPFALAASADTFSANVYIQLIFVDTHPTQNTKLSGFLPKYIPGLNLWLNASEPGNNTFTPNTGVKMLNWTDKSGQNNHALAQIATAPIYRSLPGGVGMGMYFNGNTFFSGNLKNTGKYSYTFIVARPDPRNSMVGRLLSLGARAVDDYSSNASMGVSASPGDIPPVTRRVVMGLGHLSSPNWTIKYSTSPTTTAAGGLITWADATTSWTDGACCSIAYGMGIFVAVGYSGPNGVIKYSSDGITWLNANMAAPAGSTTTSGSTNYGFYFRDADRNTTEGGGGIRVVIFTGSIWICGGVNDTSLVGTPFSYKPGLAYSYDGINWFKNTKTLPFTGTGNCITSIASDGNLIILSGNLTPSMNYSYDGINWFNMSPGAKASTQVGNTADTGIHCVLYSPEKKLWLACGDGGNKAIAKPTASESLRKIVWSVDGFNWNMTWNDDGTMESKIKTHNFENTRNVGTYLRRILSVFMRGNTHFLFSGPYMAMTNYIAAVGPAISVLNPSTVFGFGIEHACGSNDWPLNQANTNNPVEISALYHDGINTYYGMQNVWNAPAGVGGSTFLMHWTYSGYQEKPLFFHSANVTMRAVSGINGPVNVIVDNMSVDRNLKGNIHLNNTSVKDIQTDTNATRPFIINAWEDGMNTCVAVNGRIIPQNKVNPGKFNISSYMVGKNLGNAFNNYTGYIYEILVYNSLLYSSSRFAIEGYLAWKWGIQQFLPNSHTYSRNRPSVYALTNPWPKAFSDLQPLLWLDAQDPNANDSFAPEERTFIKTWFDKSGNENNLTAPTYSEPMYTKNIIKAGGIQFNRYPYKSMSYVPIPRYKDSLPNIGTTSYNPTSQPTIITNNTPFNWIPGFSGQMDARHTNVDMCYDVFGFIYFILPWESHAGSRIIQYDENNNQTRVLFRNNHTPTRDLRPYSIYVSPRNGYIYLTINTDANPAGWRPLHILIPDSFPTTPATSYPTIRIPTISRYNRSTDQIVEHRAWGAFIFVDKYENLYMMFSSGWGTDGQGYFVFPYSTNLGVEGATTFTSPFNFKQIANGGPSSYHFYSPEDNSLSVMSPDQPQLGRLKLYLDTLAVFKGTISGTTLTVISVISGTILIGTSIDAEHSHLIYPGVVITGQTSIVGGTPGGAGIYTLSIGPNTITSPTLITSMRMSQLIPNVPATGTDTTTNISTRDGLFNVGETSDILASTNRLNQRPGTTPSYDSTTNSMFMRADWWNTDNSRMGRLKRFDLTTGQVTTIGGAISRVNRDGNTKVSRHQIISEKFPVEYGVMEGTVRIYDMVFNGSNDDFALYPPLFLGANSAYYLTSAVGDLIKEISILKNFRARPSCMSGPLYLNGTTVSMFIVYSNRNSNMPILPHHATWNTPIVSLSSTDDFCEFVGGITGTVAGTFGTILTITQIISGSIQKGATIKTPEGGFLSSERPGTTMGQVGSYNVSRIQYVPPGTRITASNGIGRVSTGDEGSHNGPTLGIDTMKQDFLSLYTNKTTATVYRNNTSVAQMIPAVEENMPSSGIMTEFTGSITSETLTVTNVSSGVIEIGSIINIPGNPIKPVVIAYATTSTLGFLGTYRVEPSFSTPVPTGTKMTTDTKATRISGWINDPVNESLPGTTLFAYQMREPIGNTIQVGATLNIPGVLAGDPVRQAVIIASVPLGGWTAGNGGVGTYLIDRPIKYNGMMTLTSPIIPDILFVKSTPTETMTRVLNPTYTSVKTSGATTTSTTPFKISSIGLGLQPSNISRVRSLLPNYFFDGTICEIILYNQDVTTNFYKNQHLEGYLAWKWGAETRLPVWHLYRYIPPTSFVEKAIPTGTVAIIARTQTTFTVSWPNDNITRSYSYFLIPSSQTFTGANATDDGTTPILNSAVEWPKNRITDNWATSKSVTITGLTAGTTYKLRIMSHGSLSFVNTDAPNITLPS
jgi:hypothetical protein